MQNECRTAPQPGELSHLRPTDRAGALIIAGVSALTALALGLSAQPGVAPWLLGQLLLAIALVQWFVVLHEAGHGTLFRTRRLHGPVGHLAGFLCAIPFASWKAIHGRHHKWTGWQDVDPTTAALVPRRLSPFERCLINMCWRFRIPLFSVLYRVRNFWYAPSLWRLFPDARRRRAFAVNIAGLVVVYGTLVVWLGPLGLLRLGGLGLLGSMVFLDPIMLSQHTHIPLRLSGGARVAPFPATEQEVFTRSLRFPAWLSTLVLLHFDAHELHHLYPQVPGYLLREVRYTPGNEFEAWEWIRRARRMPAEQFMFQNRNNTGELL